VTHKSAIYSALLVASVASALGTGTVHAQFGGAIPPYEAITIVRSMGFDPVGRPAFDGVRYVVRATDPRGADVNVVVDAQLRRVVMVRPIPGSTPLSPPGGVPPGRTSTLPPEDDGPGGVLGSRRGALTDDGIPPPRPPRGLPNQASARPLPPPPREASAPEGDAARDLPTGSISPAAPAAAKPATGSAAASAAQRPDIVIQNHPPYVRTRPLPPTTSSTPAPGPAPAPQATASPAPAAATETAADRAAPTAAAPKTATALPPIAPLE
jgi:hypothetical protein